MLPVAPVVEKLAATMLAVALTLPPVVMLPPALTVPAVETLPLVSVPTTVTASGKPTVN